MSFYLKVKDLKVGPGAVTSNLSLKVGKVRMCYMAMCYQTESLVMSAIRYSINPAASV